MSLHIEASYSGLCPECGEFWQPGDLIRREGNERLWEDLRWRHVVCPEAIEKPEGAVCEHCFLRRSLTGECGCDS